MLRLSVLKPVCEFLRFLVFWVIPIVLFINGIHLVLTLTTYNKEKHYYVKKAQDLRTISRASFSNVKKWAQIQ